MSKIAGETVLQTSASLEKAYEFSDKLNEYLRSAHSCLRVRFIEYIYDGKYACFDVLGHAPWPDIDKCKEIGQVTVADQTHLHASGADLDFGFHGTHPSNAFSILQCGGFDIDFSGDAPAGVCTVPKFNATYVYDHGAVLHCSIHGVLLAINTPSRKRAFDTWAGRYIPIGANPYNKHRGSPLGQVMSHPGNLCIDRLSLKRSVIDSTISTTWIPGSCYGNKNPMDAYRSLVNYRLANGIERPKDLRDLHMPGIMRWFDLNPIVEKSFIASTRNELSTDENEHPPSVASTHRSWDTNDHSTQDVFNGETPRAPFFSQFGHPVRRPISLKQDCGDQRFAKDKKRDRKHVCDACGLCFEYRGKLIEFVAEYTNSLPKCTPEQHYWNWYYGRGDYTWLCTTCEFEARRDFDTIERFRKWAGRCIPIDANVYNRCRGSTLGRLMSHHGNLCISIVEENFVALKPTLPNSNDFGYFIAQDVKNVDNECPPHIASTLEDCPSDPDIQRSWVFIDLDDKYSSVTVASDIEDGFVVC